MKVRDDFFYKGEVCGSLWQQLLFYCAAGRWRDFHSRVNGSACLIYNSTPLLSNLLALSIDLHHPLMAHYIYMVVRTRSKWGCLATAKILQ